MWPFLDTSTAAVVAAAVLTLVAAAVYAVYQAAGPTVPVRGKTNVPSFANGWTLPIIGDAWRFIGTKDMIDVWDVIDDLVNQRRKLGTIWFGRMLVISVGEPRFAELLLNSSKTTIKPYDFYGVISDFSEGAFSSNGKNWQTLRMALDKLTHPKFVMDNYLDTFEECAKKLCTVLDSKCDKEIFDLGHLVRLIYVEMMAETVLGVPISRLKDSEDFVKSVAEVAEKAITANINAIVKVHLKMPLLKYLLKDRTVEKELDELSIKHGPDCLRVRQEILKERKCNVEDPEYTPECYADVILQTVEKENIKPDRIFTMPIEMVAVGYDTPSVALSSTCLFLAMHQELQEKAYQEQVAIMGDSLEPPTMAEIAGMVYMDMCYKETMRHVAPPGFARLVESEIVIDNYVFPEGAIIYISTYSTRKDPKYWVKTKEFYPENFLPEEIAKRPKGVFLPFAAGSRVCAGKHVAQTTIRIMLSTLLRRYHFTTNIKFEDIKYKYMVMLEPAVGYPVKITRRKKQNRS